MTKKKKLTYDEFVQLRYEFRSVDRYSKNLSEEDKKILNKYWKCVKEGKIPYNYSWQENEAMYNLWLKSDSEEKISLDLSYKELFSVVNKNNIYTAIKILFQL